MPERRAAAAPRLRDRTSWVVHLREPKRARARTVDLHRYAVDALDAWLRSRPTCETQRVFVSLATNTPPGPLTPQVVNRRLAHYASAAGLDPAATTPHSLRHTFATRAAETGEGIEVVAQLLGHADVRTTMIYAQISDERRRRTIDAAFDRPSAHLRLLTQEAPPPRGVNRPSP